MKTITGLALLLGLAACGPLTAVTAVGCVGAEVYDQQCSKGYTALCTFIGGTYDKAGNDGRGQCDVPWM